MFDVKILANKENLSLQSFSIKSVKWSLRMYINFMRYILLEAFGCANSAKNISLNIFVDWSMFFTNILQYTGNSIFFLFYIWFLPCFSVNACQLWKSLWHPNHLAFILNNVITHHRAYIISSIISFFETKIWCGAREMQRAVTGVLISAQPLFAHFCRVVV